MLKFVARLVLKFLRVTLKIVGAFLVLMVLVVVAIMSGRYIAGRPPEPSIKATTPGTSSPMVAKPKDVASVTDTEAIARFTQRLNATSRQSNPRAWALAERGLGNAYWNLGMSDNGANNEASIKHLEASLSEPTVDPGRQDEALTLYRIGIAYIRNPRGERRANFEAALASFNRALSIWTYDTHKENWARLQHNLGLVYAARQVGEENSERGAGDRRL